MEHHNAAFWVGANAVIRKSAIMELEECDYEDGIWVKRYINDRTVIEDKYTGRQDISLPAKNLFPVWLNSKFADDTFVADNKGVAAALMYLFHIQWSLVYKIR